MDGQMDRRMDGWMDGWTDGQTGAWTVGQVSRWLKRWMGGQMHGIIGLSEPRFYTLGVMVIFSGAFWGLRHLGQGPLSLASQRAVTTTTLYQPLLFHLLCSNRSVIPPSEVMMRLYLTALRWISLDREALC